MSPEASRHRRRIGRLLIANMLPLDYIPEKRPMATDRNNPSLFRLPEERHAKQCPTPEPILCVLCRRPNPNPACSACPTCLPPDEGDMRLTGKVAALEAELESTADKLTDCWLWIDTAARLQDGSSIEILRKSAERLLRKHQCPGWKDEPATSSDCMNCGMCESCIDRSIAAAEENDLDDDGNPVDDCDTCGNTGWVVGPKGMRLMCGECNS